MHTILTRITVLFALQAPAYANDACLELLQASSTSRCKPFLDSQIGSNPGLLLVLDGLIR